MGNKKGVLFLLLLISILSMILPVLSLEITLSKESYSPQETLQAEITGNFITLRNENIFIYKEGVPRPNPVISWFTKQEDAYYFYALLPNQEGNYSLRIENSQYTTGGELKNDPIIKNFIIKKSNQSALSINPGFIVADKDFSIKVKSLYSNQKITATLESSNQSQTLNLIEDNEKTLDFSISGANYQKTNLKIGNYNIPVFILKTIIPPEAKELNFIPPELKAIVTSGENYFFKIVLENSGNKNISDIKLSNNLNAVINPDAIPLLGSLEIAVINITLPVPENSKNNLSGEIKAEFGGKTQTLNVFFEITSNKTKVNLTGTTITPDLSCKDKGNLCVYPETCDRETTESLEGPCCLGNCIEEKAPSNFNWLIGVVLIAVIVLVLYFVYKKSKQNQKLKSSEDILKERTKRFNERMSGEEVSGKVGRI